MRTERKYIQIMGVPSSVNNIINTAIGIAYDHKIQELNGTLLFMACIESLDNKEDVLNKVGITYELIENSFEYIIGSSSYKHGVINNEKLITPYVFGILPIVMANISKYDSVSAFLIGLNEIPDSTLEEFLEYLEFSIEKLLEVLKESILIPEELKSFLKDANKEIQEKDEQIVSVDDYVDEMINVLARKTKKNPCLVGEAGVGKTTIVEALVQRINSGNVPNCLKDSKIYYVNNSAMIGGTRYRGDFEERLASLFEFASENNIILFLDEIHTFMSLGKNGDDSQSVGNSIKEYLNDGRISIIGTTTNKEWHKFIETDSALKRRLQEIYINEPSVTTAIDMVSKSRSNYEKYHGVLITDSAINKAVSLSDRYMKMEKLPDKAFKIIDQASATLKIQDGLVKKIVTEDDVIKVVSKLTGINVDKLSKSELSKLKTLEETICDNLVGQDEAVHKVAQAIRRGKAGVRDSNKPIASLLFVGPTGVGKTELCRLLSKEIFDNKEAFIKIDMSEFNEEYSTSKLIGSAPGYIGYGEGGMLTEKVKKHPYSLILLDEIEKANPKVFDSFLQVLDEGKLTDAQGETVDFTNCIIVMTSNAGYGADKFGKKKLGFSTDDESKTYDEKEKIAMKELESSFRPEFLNRIDNIIIFNSLDKAQTEKIVRISLRKLHNRMLEQNINVMFTDKLVTYIAEQGYSDKYGARNVNRAVQSIVEDMITDAIISEDLTSGQSYEIDYKEGFVVSNIIK